MEMKPKGYSKNSQKESSSIECLTSLFNKNKTKAYINSDDKIPNHDGNIELIDEDLCPFARFTVQVRTIPSGETKYQCETSLIAYSKTISEPFLLICVDIENKKAYWKHLYTNMPEAKLEQDSFVIHFKDIDSIDGTENYINLWKYIADDYKNRIECFPELLDKQQENLPENAKIFQEFIDIINNGFDGNWSTLKASFFADTWKIGVGIMENKNQNHMYCLFKIPYGSSGILVKSITEKDFDYTKITTKAENLISLNHVNANYWNPLNNGLKFIKIYADKALKAYRFQIHGSILASEIVISFCRHYAKYLDIKDFKNINFQDVRNKILSRFMSQDWLEKQYPNVLLRPILDTFYGFSTNAKVQIIYSPSSPWADNALSLFPREPLNEAINYLNSLDMGELLPLPDMPNRSECSFFNFSEQAEIERAKYLLNNIGPVYQEFLQGNGLSFLNSRFLDPNYSIVFYYAPRIHEGRRYSSAITYRVVENKGELLKFIVNIEKNEDAIKELFSYEKQNNIYKWIEICGFCGDSLYSSMPLFTMIYEQLKRDIEMYFKNKNIR